MSSDKVSANLANL